MKQLQENMMECYQIIDTSSKIRHEIATNILVGVDLWVYWKIKTENDADINIPKIIWNKDSPRLLLSW